MQIVRLSHVCVLLTVELVPANRSHGDPNHLGGRLRLLAASELDGAQEDLRERITATRVARGQRSGFRAALDDGRLIGPFNALLRLPNVGQGQLDWAEAISATDLSPAEREAAILTVAAQWSADYVLYAHRAAASAAGLPDGVIAGLATGQTPTNLDHTARLAHLVALALTRDHDLPDDLYTEFLSSFGETRAVALLALIGQYLATCAVVTCFRVPAP